MKLKKNKRYYSITSLRIYDYSTGEETWWWNYKR